MEEHEERLRKCNENQVAGQVENRRIGGCCDTFMARQAVSSMMRSVGYRRARDFGRGTSSWGERSTSEGKAERDSENAKLLRIGKEIDNDRRFKDMQVSDNGTPPRC